MNIPTTFIYWTTHIRDTWRINNQNWIFPLTNRIIGLCVILSIGIIIWKWQSLPPLVPLLRSHPWGSDRLVSPYWLFLLPLASLCWHIIDITISIMFTHEHRIFTQVLLLSSMVVAILSTIITVSVIFLVI
jgi:hypothetical protein